MRARKQAKNSITRERERESEIEAERGAKNNQPTAEPVVVAQEDRVGGEAGGARDAVVTARFLRRRDRAEMLKY